MLTPVVSPRCPTPKRSAQNSTVVSPLTDGEEESKRCDQELDIFDAERYFKEDLNPAAAVPDIGGGGFDCRKRLSPSLLANKRKLLPSISGASVSSGSSINSRSILLHTRKSDRKTIVDSAAVIFGRCCCTGTNSVETLTGKSSKGSGTKTHVDCLSSKMEYRFQDPNLRMNSCRYFSFPTQNPTTGNQADCVGIRRKIRSHVPEHEKKPAISAGESESDSSSDLFEIDILSTGNGFSTPRNCYAPSEASIQWSIITASAAEISVASDSDKLTHKPGFKPTAKPGGPKSFLSGCKSDKAVGVVEDAHKEQSLRKSREEKQHHTQKHNPSVHYTI